MNMCNLLLNYSRNIQGQKFGTKTMMHTVREETFAIYGLFANICSAKIKCYYEKRYECHEKLYDFQIKLTETGHNLQKFVLRNCLG